MATLLKIDAHAQPADDGGAEPSNAILAWNARYLTAALDDVRGQQPELIRDDALAQLSPVGHAHVNPNGALPLRHERP